MTIMVKCMISYIIIPILRVQGAIFTEEPGCFAPPFPLATEQSATGPIQCFTRCQTVSIAIVSSYCFCTLPPLTSIPCDPAVTCQDGHSPCGFAADIFDPYTYSISVYKLNACFLTIPYDAIEYGSFSDPTDDSRMLEVGKSVTVTCGGFRRYPNVGTEWWLSKTVQCVEVMKWENIVDTLECNVACEKPILENAIISPPSVNIIGKVDVGTTVTASCNDGLEISPGVEVQILTCQGTSAKWEPEVICKPRCRLLCVNGGACIEDLIGKSQRCSCTIGFTGALCETAITNAPYVNELLKIRDQMALFTTVADMSLYIMAQIPVHQRIELEVPSNELISECSIAARPCGPYRQNAFVHMGSCYTINYDARNATIIKQAGVGRGMHLVLFNNDTEFLAHSLVKGVKLIIHDQDDAVFPENQGRFLSSGFHVMIGIKLEQIKKFYKKCASADMLPKYFYNGSYTHEGCLKSCHQKKVIETCGCGDPNVDLDPKDPNLRYCSLTKRDCVNSVKSITNEECRCPEACRTSIYEATYSFAKWPKKNYNVSICKHLSKEKVWKGKWLKKCNEAFRASHVKIDIYYEDLAYSVYTEYPVYSFWDLWSGVGSSLAMFFSISYMFFFETLVLICDLCVAAVKKIIRLWRKMFSAVSPIRNVQE